MAKAQFVYAGDSTAVAAQPDPRAFGTAITTNRRAFTTCRLINTPLLFKSLCAQPDAPSSNQNRAAILTPLKLNQAPTTRDGDCRSQKEGLGR